MWERNDEVADLLEGIAKPLALKGDYALPPAQSLKHLRRCKPRRGAA